MKRISTIILMSLMILPSITFAQRPSESLHMNSRRITWNSAHTNGSFDVQWARSVDGPWYDTWDAMLGIPATNGVITVAAPHFFRVVHRPLPGDAVASYLGYRWNCYRTEWDIGKEWITSLPQARAGFNYGINGDGRGPNITTHENDAQWKDYTTEFDLELLGVNPSFNPYGIPSDYHNANFFFRLQSMAESWHDETLNSYFLQLNDSSGSTLWRLGRCNDYGYYGGGTSTHLQEGYCDVDLSTTNRVKVSCIGNEITAWINDEQIVSFTDTSSAAFTHGGLGFRFQWESMGRFRNMTITHHEEDE